MRVLLCQTPRITYVQAIELLQRETSAGSIDMAMFPEMAIEHPPQCTGQGELTFENVAMLMLSRFCKQRRMYLVLGSVEERSDHHAYDTCVVLNRDGEMLYFYRKQSKGVVGKDVGHEPGIFDSEFGPIGILLGSEVEEEQRWQDLLVRKPYLILNPARAPMQLDPVLIHSHPEFQVSTWHKSLRRIEHIVETRTRHCSVSFVRADAPFGDGGAGTTLLVEPHRSVFAPRWGPVFCIVDTLHPYELEGRKLPGWRQLSVDERAQMAARDRALLTQEEIERGPRYLVWTLRPNKKGGLRMPRTATQWSNGVSGRDKFATIETNLENMVTVVRPASFLVPLTAANGAHQVYATINSTGQLILWDLKLKREISSSTLGATGLTAASNWIKSNQIIVASSSKGVVTLKVFEEHEPAGEIKFDSCFKVVRHRKTSAYTRGSILDGISEGKRSSTEGGKRSSTRSSKQLPKDMIARVRTPHVMALFHVGGSQAAVVLEADGDERGPSAKLVDMDLGDVFDLDVYGNGPQDMIDDSDNLPSHDDDHGMQHGKADKLVQACMVEQQIKGRKQHVLACLYDSNRLVQSTLQEGELYDMMLLEDQVGDRHRYDIPICWTVLPNQQFSDTYHAVVSYQSLMVRWWQVGLTTSKMLSQVTLQAAVTHLIMFDWPPPPGAGQPNSISLPVEKPAGVPAGPKRGNTRFSVGPTSTDRASILRGRQSVRVVTDEYDQQAHGQRASLLPLVGVHGGLNGFIKQRASFKHGRISEAVEGRYTQKHRQQSISGAGGISPDDDLLLTKDHSCLCVIAFDASGGMPILLARGGRIAKLYTGNDHFVERSAKVDQLVCDGHTIAVQISNGDIRHIEFVFEEDLISLKDVPMDSLM